MGRTLRAIFLLGLVGAACVQPSSAQSDLWVSADLKGRLLGCEACPSGAGGPPSFAQRSLWWQNAAPDSSHWLDAGGAFVGVDTFASLGVAMVVAMNSAGVHAAHITASDLKPGWAPMRDALHRAQFSRFSANLVDADSGARLFDGFALVPSAEGPRVAIGLSAQTAGPHDGVSVGDLAECLGLALDEAAAAAPNAPVILCFHGEGSQLRELPRALLDRCDSVVHTGAYVQVELGPSGPPVHYLRDGSRAMLQGDRGGAWVARSIARQGASDAVVQAALSETVSFKKLSAQPLASSEEGEEPPRARNRAMEVSIMGTEQLPEWRDRSAPEGYEWFVIEMDIENKLARDLRKELEYIDAIHIAGQTRQLFLRVGGRRLLRPIETAPVPLTKRLYLSEPGDFITQRLGYLLPVGDTARLELCVFHDEFAPIVLPVRDGDVVAPAVVPIAEAENEAMRALLPAVPHPGKAGAQTTVWQADVLAQSKILLETDARALRRDAPLDERAPLGKPLEYLMAPEMVALVDTEGRHFFPLTTPDVDTEPVFGTESATGALWAFELPNGAEPEEIWLALPGLRFTHEGEQRDPEPLSLRWADGEPAKQIAAPLHSLGGTPVAVDLVWAKFHEGRLSAGVDIYNLGPVAGMLEPLGRLKVNGSTKPSGVTLGLPGSGRLFLVPGARRFRLDLGFDLAADAKFCTLDFSGVDGVHSVGLEIEGEAVTVAVPGGVAPPVPVAADPIVAEAPSDEAVDPAEPEALAADVVEELLPPEAKGIAGVGLTAQQVNEAIDRGADFLWEDLKSKSKKEDLSDIGSNNREEVLALFALTHTDLRERNPEFARVLPLAIQHFDRYLYDTYANSVICMMLDHLGDSAYQPLMRRAVKAIVEGQRVDGTWGYSLPRLKKPVDAAGYVSVFSPQPDDLVRTAPYTEKTGGDNSVAQFVMMALRSAKRQGLNVPDDVWARTRTTMMGRANKDGGWGYTGPGSTYGSMTCAGIGSLAIADWALDVQDDESKALIRGGLAWMAEKYKADSNPPRGSHNFYYMYSTERVGRLLDIEFYGQNEWYPLGAKALVNSQQVDGSWIEKREIVPPTSFALLFLTRATESLMEEPVVAATGTLDINAKALEDRAVLFIMDASGSMLSKLGERTKLDWARDAMQGLTEGLDESVFMGLRVYGHRLRANAEGAGRDTELLLPLEAFDDGRSQELRTVLSSLKARGKTPMAYSLQESLKDIDRQMNGTVVLLTDGGEDPRSGMDPVAVALRFESLRKWDLAIVGFDIGKAALHSQLQEMADAAGGIYVASDTGDDLLRTLRAALVPLPEQIELVPDDGSPSRTVTLPCELELAGGLYHLRFEVAGNPFDVPVRVINGGKSRVTLDPSRFQAE